MSKEIRNPKSECRNSNEAAIGNPFSTRAVRPRALPYLFAGGATAAQLVERLAAQGWRGQIIGPHGSGKSTLLAALVPQIETAGRRVVSFTLHDGQRRLPREHGGSETPLPSREGPGEGLADAATTATMVIVDGYEQLSTLSRWLLRARCLRHGWGLLVTAHQSVGLPTLWTTTVSPEQAAEIAELLQRGRVNPLTREQVAAALARHGGNLRDALFELYDEYERRRR